MDETKGTTKTDALPPIETEQREGSLSFWFAPATLLFTCIMMLVGVSRHLNDIEVIAKAREIITSQRDTIESLMRDNDRLLRQPPPVFLQTYNYNTAALAKLTEANETLRFRLKMAEDKNEWLNSQVKLVSSSDVFHRQMMHNAWAREDDLKARAEKAERGCYAITPQGTWPGVVLTPVVMPSGRTWGSDSVVMPSGPVALTTE